MALSGNEISRLGLYGGPRGKYDLSLLSNKVPPVAPDPVKSTRPFANIAVGKMMGA